ncbi:uncharacterized protein LOC142343021 [Convolutriloba macropyga]|uniref:uncharacterized protein LOC142343021 n=1 Tax=Convolutriloba macropyga TaxID=536237 RepID=UPI003F5238A7
MVSTKRTFLKAQMSTRKTISSPFVEPDNPIQINNRESQLPPLSHHNDSYQTGKVGGGLTVGGGVGKSAFEYYEELISKTYHFDVNERLDGVYGCAEAFKFYRGDRTREARTVAVMETLKCDTEPKIRLELLRQLTIVANYCSRLAQRDHFYKNALENIVFRCMADFTKDGTTEIRRAAKKMCLEIVKNDKMNGHTLRKLLFAQAISMIENRASPVFKYEGIDLWFDLKPVRKHALVLMETFKDNLSDESAQNEATRSYYCSKLKEFCLLLNYSQFKQDFMKLLMLLAEDTDSSVRMNVAPVIVEIAKLAPNRDQEDILIPMYDDLLNDSSRLVRNSAYEMLGVMIFSTRKTSAGYRRPRSISLASSAARSTKTRDRESRSPNPSEKMTNSRRNGRLNNRNSKFTIHLSVILKNRIQAQQS